MLHAGAFIVFEGLDRSGKTTQVNKLMDHLKAREVSGSVTPVMPASRVCVCVCVCVCVYTCTQSFDAGFL